MSIIKFSWKRCSWYYNKIVIEWILPVRKILASLKFNFKNSFSGTKNEIIQFALLFGYLVLF